MMRYLKLDYGGYGSDVIDWTCCERAFCSEKDVVNLK